MSAQGQTVASVARRGYLDGWTDGELLARQVVKLAEELAELAECIDGDDPVLLDFLRVLRQLNRPARRLFDQPDAFVGAECVNTKQARSELTDCAVVLSVAAHALDVPDIMYAASQKAANDEARGVRKNGDQRP